MRTPDEVLAALQPLGLRVGKLQLGIESVRRDDERFYVTVRLIVFDDDGLVRDIKEQELWAPAPLFEDLDRLSAFAGGHADALRLVFEAPAAEIDRVMPHDLLNFSVLELVRPQRSEEFTEALLLEKRLGKLRA